jgi:hypothetical protein
MAISINTVNVFDVLDKLAPATAGQSIVAQLKQEGVTYEVTPAKVSFKKGSETLATCFTKPQMLKDILDGKEPPISVKIGLLDAAKLAVSGGTTISPASFTVQQKSAMEILATLKSAKENIAVKDAPTNAQTPVNPSPATTVAGIFPIEKMTGSHIVKLHQATQLYEPVHGSSAGSRYFVVALRPDLKVAARYRKNQLSVRIEGQGLSSYSKYLSDAGFPVQHGQTYTSLHLNVPTTQLAARSLGAVLGGLDMEWQTAAPKISVIANKGV